MLDVQKGHPALQTIWQWCCSMTDALGNVGEEDVERMAHDIGISALELRQLASHGPQSADLLMQRMAALDLDRNEVVRTEPATFNLHHLPLSSALRPRPRPRSLDPVWKDYCPNAPIADGLERAAVDGPSGMVTGGQHFVRCSM
jgi:hypothetical protein